MFRERLSEYPLDTLDWHSKHVLNSIALAWVLFSCPSSGGYDGVICIWNIVTGQLIAKHSVADLLCIKEYSAVNDLSSGKLAVSSIQFLENRHAPEADYDSEWYHNVWQLTTTSMCLEFSCMCETGDAVSSNR